MAPPLRARGGGGPHFRTSGRPPASGKKKTKVSPGVLVDLRSWGGKKWKRRRAGPSPPPHRDILPSYARRRRGARRGGAGVGMLGRRERPPGRQRPGAERGVYGKKPFRPSNRPSPTDAPRMGTPHRASPWNTPWNTPSTSGRFLLSRSPWLTSQLGLEKPYLRKNNKN